MFKKSFFPIAAMAALISAALFWVFDRVQMMPVAASEEAAVVDHAFNTMLQVTIPIYSIVVSVLLYVIWNCRSQDDREQGPDFKNSPSHSLEIGWIAGSVILTAALAAYGCREFLHIKNDRHAELDVQVRASQWSWEFYYPDRNLTTSALILPRGKPVRIILTSDDVVHAFWIPEFRLKQDALPGRRIPLVITPSKTGEYELVCAELCGLDHSVMRAKVTVVEPEEFEESMKGESW